MIPCGTSDISVRVKHFWCCSPRGFFQVCSWTPCWWCSKVTFYSHILSFVLRENSFAIPSWGLWASVFLELLGVSSWTDLQNPSHFPQIYCIWCDPKCFFQNCWEGQSHLFYWWNPSAGGAFSGYVSDEQYTGCWIHLGVKQVLKNLEVKAVYENRHREIKVTFSSTWLFYSYFCLPFYLFSP